MKRWPHIVVAAGAVALFVVACGGGESAAGGRSRIPVTPKGTTHEFWKSIHAGAAKAAAELEVEILWMGPAREDDRDDQIKVVENMISRRVDGIVIAPLDDRALVRPLADAAREGIPVVVIDSGLDWDGMVSFVATDNRAGGVLGARALGERMGGRGEALMMRYMEGSASTIEREKGFLETMAAEFPGIEIVSSNQYAGATVESATQTAENLLINHPALDGIFCPNESSTFGMLLALRSDGRAGDVHFVGFDAGEKLIEGLEEGAIEGLVVQNPFRMGEDGVRTIVAHLARETVPERIDTGVVVVTSGNVGEAGIQDLLHPDLERWLK